MEKLVWNLKKSFKMLREHRGHTSLRRMALFSRRSYTNVVVRLFKTMIKNVFKKHRHVIHDISMLFIIEFKYGRSGYDNGIVKDFIYTAIIRFHRKRTSIAVRAGHQYYRFPGRLLCNTSPPSQCV